MSYIIVCRHPNGKLSAIIEPDTGAVSEFTSEDEAEQAASNTTACLAWPYQILEVH